MAVELTDLETELLCSVFNMESQIQEIQSGELSGPEEQLLVQLRNLEGWLKGKYPSHGFQVLSIQRRFPPNATVDYFVSADVGEEPFIVSAPDEGSTAFRERFYKVLYRRPCEARLLQLLQGFRLPVTALEVFFPGDVGDEVDERTTVEELAADGEKVSRRTTVFLRGDRDELSRARRVLEEQRLWGGYLLYASEEFLPALDAEACWAVKLAKPEAVASASFRLTAENQRGVET